MLSRVADSLYWMGRYLERAEHTARVIDVHLDLMIDQATLTAEKRRRRLLLGLRAPRPNVRSRHLYDVIHTLTFDRQNHNSILLSIQSARENARHVREQISSEMWEQLNGLHLALRQTQVDHTRHDRLRDFFQSVSDGVHLFRGTTDARMSHNEGWHFIQLGGYMERAQLTAALLDAHYRIFEYMDADSASSAEEYVEWVSLLMCCTAFEAYRTRYTADLTSDRIAEFLLLDGEFPHSLHFCADMVYTALNEISNFTGASTNQRLNRLAGRLRASLGYGQIDEIMEEGIHGYLAGLQKQCNQIHAALYQTYIEYSIEHELVV